MAALVGKHIQLPQDVGSEKNYLDTLKLTFQKDQVFKKNSLQQFNNYENIHNKFLKKIQTNVLLHFSMNINSQVKIEQYKLTKPHFGIYLEHLQKNYLNEIKNVSMKNITAETFLYMRAILDSRYNQMIIVDHWKNYNGFSQFTFGFLEKYKINKKSRRIQKNLYNRQIKQNLMLQFFVDLMNSKLDKVWQVITFRQFLMDNATNDQIYFYLHWRNQLYGGNQLQNYINAADPIVYSEIQKVNELIQVCMCKYEKTIIEKIKNNITAKKKKKKNNKQFVDSNFVLRTLLEMYRLQKKNRAIFLKQAFALISNPLGFKNHIYFQNFKQFLEINFPYLTVSQIAEIYRQCYNIGKGQIKYQVFFILGCQGFFIKLFRFKPVYIKDAQNNNNLCLKQLENFTNILTKNLRIFQKIIPTLGNEYIEKQFFTIYSLLLKRQINEIYQLNQGIPILLFTKRIQNILSKIFYIIANKYYYFIRNLNGNTITTNQHQVLSKVIKNFINKSNECTDLSNQITFTNTRRIIAAYKLTSCLRYKVLQEYLQIGKILNQKLNE